MSAYAGAGDNVDIRDTTDHPPYSSSGRAWAPITVVP